MITNFSVLDSSSDLCGTDMFSR